MQEITSVHVPIVCNTSLFFSHILIRVALSGRGIYHLLMYSSIIRVSNFFSSGARLRTAGAPRSKAEGFTEARSAERGRVGEGVTPSRRWGSGGSPWKFLENCLKMVHFGAF